MRIYIYTRSSSANRRALGLAKWLTLDRSGMASRSTYEPLPRYRHVSQHIGNRVLVQGGRTRDFSERNRKRLTSVVEIFNPYFEEWEQKQVRGDAPTPGTYAAASASLHHDLYTFGGLCTTTKQKESNRLHRLDTKTWRWYELSPKNAEGAPMPKFGCGMVAFSTDGLGIFGGHALPHTTQPPAETFMKNVDHADGSGWTNEFHTYNVKKGVWSCPATTGERPPPCSHLTFTAIDDRRAVLFGGYNRRQGFMDDLFIMNLHTMHWIKAKKTGDGPWPGKRASHAACCLNHYGEYPQLLVTGGMNSLSMPFTDIWTLDARTGHWRMMVMSEPLKPRWGHTVTAFSLGPGLTELTVFGGTAIPWKGSEDKQPKLAETTLLQVGLIESGQWELLSVATQCRTLERVFEKMRFVIESKLPVIEESQSETTEQVCLAMQGRERVRAGQGAENECEQARLESQESEVERVRLTGALERLKTERNRMVVWLNTLQEERDRAVTETKEAEMEKEMALKVKEQGEADLNMAVLETGELRLQMGKLTAALQKTEEERGRMTVWVQTLQSERNQALLGKQKVEAERDKVVMWSRNLQVGMDRALAEKQKVESEKKLVMSQKEQKEEELKWAILERDQAKADRDRALEDKMQVEIERESVKMAMQLAEQTRDRALMEKLQTESARNRDMGVKLKSEGNVYKMMIEKQQAIEERDSLRIKIVHLEHEVYQLQQENNILTSEKLELDGEVIALVQGRQQVEQESAGVVLEKQNVQEKADKMTIWAQQMEGERDILIAEKQKMKEQRDRAMAWATQAERERESALVEKQKAQEEREEAKNMVGQAEQAKNRAVVEKLEAERDRDMAVIEKQEAEQMKKNALLEKRDAVEERQREKEAREIAVVERDNLMLEKQETNEQRNRALAAKQQAEQERDSALMSQQHAEEERNQVQMEKRRVEDERDRLLFEKHHAQSEKCGALMDKLQTDGELDVVRVKKLRAEEEWDRAMISKREAEEERDRALAELQKTQHERDILFQEKQQSEKEKISVMEEAEREKERAILEREKLEGERDEALGRLDEVESRTNELEGMLNKLEEREQKKLVICEQVRKAELRGPSWEVKGEEIEIADESLGIGGWAEVKVARLKVAAKCLHQQLVFDYHHDLFKREMTFAAKVSHPNLLRFLGARLEGGMAIFTEFMPTSLRAEVNRCRRNGEQSLSLEHTLTIGIDINRALNYLHNFTPDPILHRDLSSANVLLQPSSKGGWFAKLSDYGTVNFYSKLQTGNPGNPVYTAPESSEPDRQTPKMDIYSFGVLLIEMSTCEFPIVERRQELMEMVKHDELEHMITSCLKDDPEQRPFATQLVTMLQTIQKPIIV